MTPVRRAVAAAVCLMIAALSAAHGDELPLVEFPVKPDAPALSLPQLDGAPFDLARYTGRTVVVNFWATWCLPCIKELPALEEAWQKLQKRDVVLVAVNMGDTPERIRRFLARRPVSFPILMDAGSQTSTPWQIQGLPTTYVVGPDGRIHYGAIGDRDWSSDAILDPVFSLK